MMGKVVKYTSEELKKMKSETDWDAVRNMTDAQIDEAAAGDPVWQEMGGDDWTDQVELAPEKEGIYAKFDQDVIAYYKSFGRGYQARMNAVLKAYMKSHPRDTA
jgi:uncharacterized protein (DUF4415 family)